MLKLTIRYNVEVDKSVEEYCGGDFIAGATYYYSLYMNWIDTETPEDTSRQEFIKDFFCEQDALDSVKQIKKQIPMAIVEQKSFNPTTKLFDFKEIT